MDLLVWLIIVAAVLVLFVVPVVRLIVHVLEGDSRGILGTLDPLVEDDDLGDPTPLEVERP